MTDHGSRSAMTPGWRDAFVNASAVLALTVVVINEVLSSLHALTTVGVLTSWAIIAVALGGWIRRRGAQPMLISQARIPAMTREDKLYVAFIAFICLVTLYVAIAGAPNATDSLQYHMPRVLRWVQDRTLAFYPTHSTRQLWIGPGWEHFALQLQLLMGTDRLSNLVQWLAMVWSPVVMSLLARELGATRRGQLLAALFTLSIPMGIAEASGSQVDLFAGFWLGVSVALLLRIKRQRIEHTTSGTALLLGCAVGMAVLTKATNALFLIPFGMWVAAGLVRESRLARMPGLVLIALVPALVMNAPHMTRNKSVFDSVLGLKGAFGVANEKFGPRALVSNVVRNAALHLNTPSDELNASMTRAIGRLHSLAGMDASDPRLTYKERAFEVPAEWDNEGQGSNQFHFLVVLAVGLAATVKMRSSPATRYLWCTLAAALIFCIYLKWQPWHSRLHLPLFMIAAPGIGAALQELLSPKRLRWVAVALALVALHPTFRNTMRPIATRNPMWTVGYEHLLLNELRRWTPYAGAADFVAARRCSRIGLIGGEDIQEYPMWKLIERRIGAVPEVRHVFVTNSTRAAMSDRDRAFRPCAILDFQHMSRDTWPPVAAPPGFERAWNLNFITIFLPAKS